MLPKDWDNGAINGGYEMNTTLTVSSGILTWAKGSVDSIRDKLCNSCGSRCNVQSKGEKSIKKAMNGFIKAKPAVAIFLVPKGFLLEGRE